MLCQSVNDNEIGSRHEKWKQPVKCQLQRGASVDRRGTDILELLRATYYQKFIGSGRCFFKDGIGMVDKFLVINKVKNFLGGGVQICSLEVQSW